MGRLRFLTEVTLVTATANEPKASSSSFKLKLYDRKRTEGRVAVSKQFTLSTYGGLTMCATPC